MSERQMTPRFAKRAARRARNAERLGLKPLDEPRLQAAFERRLERKRSDDYVGCASVTQTAQALGMRRSILFEWLDREGWMYRTYDGGWLGTPHALTKGWVVMRGPASIEWPQVTPLGRAELEKRIGPRADD